MPHLDGAHHHGGSGASLGVPLAAGAGVVLAAAILPTLIALLHALIIAVAVAVGVLLAASAAFLVWRLRRPAPVPPWQPGTLQPHQRPAVPREVHLHLHGATAEDIAQALAQLPQQSTGPSSPASHYHPTIRQEHQP